MDGDNRKRFLPWSKESKEFTWEKKRRGRFLGEKGEDFFPGGERERGKITKPRFPTPREKKERKEEGEREIFPRSPGVVKPGKEGM